MSTLDFQVGVDQCVDVYQETGITQGVPDLPLPDGF